MSTVKVSAVAAEIIHYNKINTKLISTAIYNNTGSALDAYCKVISKVNGKFPQFHTAMSHVVQGFKAEWNAMGKAQFIGKMLKNYRQKVNYPIVPNDIYGTYLGDMYAEGKTPKEMPISKWILEKELLPKIAEDVEHLCMDGTYDSDRLGEYGYSMQGINQVIAEGKANTDNPYFKIPTELPSDVNILEVITQFERNLPKKLKKGGKCPIIFMSDTMLENYSIAYGEKYGDNHLVQKDVHKTLIGKRTIVGLPWLNDDIIFTTPKGNLAKLIDVSEPGEITGLEEGIYDIKVAMEFHLGYDFLINEVVCIADPGTVRGLGSSEKMELYYPKEKLTSLV